MNQQQIKLFTSKETDDWATPRKLYLELDREFHFTFDPCPLNHTFDGLSVPWHGRVYCNPPYSQVYQWLRKGWQEIENRNADLIVYLVFANTDTKWFHELVYNKAEVRFLRGRVKFVGKASNSAMRPSMLVIIRALPEEKK